MSGRLTGLAWALKQRRMTAAREELRDALVAADVAAVGGSNDAEIEALQRVRDLACELLDLDPDTGEDL